MNCENVEVYQVTKYDVRFTWVEMAIWSIKYAEADF